MDYAFYVLDRLGGDAADALRVRGRVLLLTATDRALLEAEWVMHPVACVPGVRGSTTRRRSGQRLARGHEDYKRCHQPRVLEDEALVECGFATQRDRNFARKRLRAAISNGAAPAEGDVNVDYASLPGRDGLLRSAPARRVENRSDRSRHLPDVFARSTVDAASNMGYQALAPVPFHWSRSAVVASRSWTTPTVRVAAPLWSDDGRVGLTFSRTVTRWCSGRARRSHHHGHASSTVGGTDQQPASLSVRTRATCDLAPR